MGLCASEVLNPNEVDMTHFQVMTTIGAGGFGKVRLAVDLKEQRINPNKYVAMKFLKMSYYYKPHRRKQLLREREALSTINSPFVVRILHSFKTTYEIVFVMPFLQGGDFCVYLSRKSLSEEQVRFAAAEIVLGLEAIHRESYVYRDLKPENILLDSNGHCVITDLGLVAMISDFDTKYNEPFSKRWDPPHHCRIRGVSGTPGYMAPEVFVKSYDQLADFFALGALIYSLFTNKIPFPNQSRKYFFKTAFVLPDGVNRLSKHSQSFVKGLCAYYEKDRLGYRNFWDDVKEHPFFEEQIGFSWDAIAQRKSKSPFQITEDFNFDIRYNLEDTFAINYGMQEIERIGKDELKKIYDQLKGVSYNNMPPFKLSDGTYYNIGKTSSGAAPRTKAALKQTPPKNQSASDKKDVKKNLLKLRPTISHISKLSMAMADTKGETCKLSQKDSKRVTPEVSHLTPQNSEINNVNRQLGNAEIKSASKFKQRMLGSFRGPSSSVLDPSNNTLSHKSEGSNDKKELKSGTFTKDERKIVSMEGKNYLGAVRIEPEEEAVEMSTKDVRNAEDARKETERDQGKIFEKNRETPVPGSESPTKIVAEMKLPKSARATGTKKEILPS